MANVDGTKETPLHGLLHWLRNPSNWLSLGSIVISVVTFLYVQFYPGSVTIYLPHVLAVSAPPALVLGAEYKQRYGKLRPGTERYVDQIAPVKWALPFAILGRELQTRMLVFRCSEAFPSQSVAPVPWRSPWRSGHPGIRTLPQSALINSTRGW
jgi:hypothetical protein